MNTAAAFEVLFINSGSDLVGVVNGLEGFILLQFIIAIFDFMIVAFLLRKSGRQKILERIRKQNAELGGYPFLLT